MKIAVENSTWNNVGDGFYQASLERFLSEELDGSEVVSFDGPIERGFRPTGKFKKNAFKSELYVEADIYVLSGPIFNETFFAYYEDFIRKIKSKRRRYIILSAHGSDRPVTNEIKKFLSAFSPSFMVTRDPLTYSLYCDLPFKVFNGLCFAYLVNELQGIADLSFDTPTIASSFYKQSEPYISEEKINLISSNSFVVGKKKGGRISKHFDFLKKTPSYSDFNLIRLHHDIAYKFSHINFSSPNTYVSYNPKNYLSIYKSANLVISDRVHACVAALAYGKKVFYFGDDPRDSIFDQPFISKSDLELSCDTLTLQKEAKKMKEFIVSELNSLL